jgi:hypothetical protein
MLPKSSKLRGGSEGEEREREREREGRELLWGTHMGATAGRHHR